MSESEGTLGESVLDGAVGGGGLFGPNLEVGAGVLNAREALNPAQKNLSRAMIAGSLAGAGVILVDEWRKSR